MRMNITPNTIAAKNASTPQCDTDDHHDAHELEKASMRVERALEIDLLVIRKKFLRRF